jgi:aminoglycoside phosphotransferase
MFPIFIRSNEDRTSYEIEKIIGISASTLYINEELTITQLDNIINSIKRLHNITPQSNNINIYSNYKSKVQQRYDENDYTDYPKSKEVYNYIIYELEQYENKDKGKQVTIHGDPVLTNIIINNLGKIKFIDMKGIQGDDLTITGDWLYDWAKLYQSLIGYDEILLNTRISNSYKKKIIDRFYTKFLEIGTEEDWNNMKLICKSLLFSLIPLHSCRDKKNKYYNLIDSIYLQK